MALIRTLTVSTTAFEITKEKFDGFRQTVQELRLLKILEIKGKDKLTFHTSHSSEAPYELKH